MNSFARGLAPDPDVVRWALKEGHEILVGVAKQIAPGARELVGTPFGVSSVIVGERLEPFFASIWLPASQGLMNVDEVQVGGFRLDKLKGTRGIRDGWIVLRLADPVRVKDGDEVMLLVRNCAEARDVDRLATDPREFRAMLGFIVERDKAPTASIIV